MVIGSVVDRSRGTSFRRLAILAVLGLFGSLLIGCSMGDGTSDPDPAPTSAATVASTPAPVVQLGAVVWSTGLAENGEPAADLDALPRDAPVIYAVAPVQSVVAGEKVTANWSLDGVPIDALATTVTLDEATDSGWVSFALTWEGETFWPVGSLEVSLSASSGSTVTSSIQIEST